MQFWCNLTYDEWKISVHHNPLNFVKRFSMLWIFGMSCLLVSLNSQRDDSESYFRVDVELVVVVMGLKSNIT